MVFKQGVLWDFKTEVQTGGNKRQISHVSPSSWLHALFARIASIPSFWIYPTVAVEFAMHFCWGYLILRKFKRLGSDLPWYTGVCIPTYTFNLHFGFFYVLQLLNYHLIQGGSKFFLVCICAEESHLVSCLKSLPCSKWNTNFIPRCLVPAERLNCLGSGHWGADPSCSLLTNLFHL